MDRQGWRTTPHKVWVKELGLGCKGRVYEFDDFEKAGKYLGRMDSRTRRLWKPNGMSPKLLSEWFDNSKVPWILITNPRAGMTPLVMWLKPLSLTETDTKWEEFLNQQDWGHFEDEEVDEIDSDGVDELPTGLAPPEHDEELDDFRFLGLSSQQDEKEKPSQIGWKIGEKDATTLKKIVPVGGRPIVVTKRQPSNPLQSVQARLFFGTVASAAAHLKMRCPRLLRELRRALWSVPERNATDEPEEGLRRPQGNQWAVLPIRVARSWQARFLSDDECDLLGVTLPPEPKSWNQQEGGRGRDMAGVLDLAGNRSVQILVSWIIPINGYSNDDS
eukprot:Platyproteum_vivax@DN3859_c0_g1_i1.p1